jgi:hypothetical protein
MLLRIPSEKETLQVDRERDEAGLRVHHRHDHVHRHSEPEQCRAGKSEYSVDCAAGGCIRFLFGCAVGGILRDRAAATAAAAIAAAVGGVVAVVAAVIIVVSSLPRVK